MDSTLAALKLARLEQQLTQSRQETQLAKQEQFVLLRVISQTVDDINRLVKSAQEWEKKHSVLSDAADSLRSTTAITGKVFLSSVQQILECANVKIPAPDQRDEQSSSSSLLLLPLATEVVPEGAVETATVALTSARSVLRKLFSPDCFANAALQQSNGSGHAQVVVLCSNNCQGRSADTPDSLSPEHVQIVFQEIEYAKRVSLMTRLHAEFIQRCGFFVAKPPQQQHHHQQRRFGEQRIEPQPRGVSADEHASQRLERQLEQAFVRTDATTSSLLRRAHGFEDEDDREQERHDQEEEEEEDDDDEVLLEAELEDDDHQQQSEEEQQRGRALPYALPPRPPLSAAPRNGQQPGMEHNNNDADDALSNVSAMSVSETTTGTAVTETNTASQKHQQQQLQQHGRKGRAASSTASRMGQHVMLPYQRSVSFGFDVVEVEDSVDLHVSPTRSKGQLLPVRSLRVVNVRDASAAFFAGIHCGDVLHSVNMVEVRDHDELLKEVEAIRRQPFGTPVIVSVYRGESNIATERRKIFQFVPNEEAPQPSPTCSPPQHLSAPASGGGAVNSTEQHASSLLSREEGSNGTKVPLFKTAAVSANVARTSSPPTTTRREQLLRWQQANSPPPQPEASHPVPSLQPQKENVMVLKLRSTIERLHAMQRQRQLASQQQENYSSIDNTVVTEIDPRSCQPPSPLPRKVSPSPHRGPQAARAAQALSGQAAGASRPGSSRSSPSQHTRRSSPRPWK